MLKRILYCFTVTLVLAACGGSSGTPEVQLPEGAPANIAVGSRLIGREGPAVPGEPAPDFQYTMADGSSVRLSELRGKKVLINFWATWCEPCRSEMPDLEKAAQTYGDSLAVIGVNKGEQADVFPAFLGEIPVSFPLVANPEGDIALAYGVVSGIPQTVFVNSDGTVASRHLAPMSYSAISAQLDQLK
ncbi:MAG TPA: TlpA disulfide reductase family protein [Roseiflexaceae bacterium]|nr:TlpA disulfide reductase family protein [Roseiflexaceae bacterium]